MCTGGGGGAYKGAGGYTMADGATQVRNAWRWASSNSAIVGVAAGALLVMYGFYRLSIRLMKFFLNVSDKQIFNMGCAPPSCPPPSRQRRRRQQAPMTARNRRARLSTRASPSPSRCVCGALAAAGIAAAVTGAQRYLSISAGQVRPCAVHPPCTLAVSTRRAPFPPLGKIMLCDRCAARR